MIVIRTADRNTRCIPNSRDYYEIQESMSNMSDLYTDELLAKKAPTVRTRLLRIRDDRG